MKLFVGDTSALLEFLQDKKRPTHFLLIDDGEIIDSLSFPKTWKVERFDISKDSFNPLKDIDHKKARDIASTLYSVSPQGENTLTVRNGKRALAKLLLTAKRIDRMRFDRTDPQQEAKVIIEDVLFSPILKRVLCSPTNISFEGIVLARLNRAELGDFDCFVLGNLLISQYHGLVIIPDFGFYGAKHHTALIRQNRLIAGVRHLDHPMKNDLLLIKDKVGRKCLFEDAEALAKYKGYAKGTNDYNDEVQDAMK